jgi:AhpC/TSA family
VRVPTENEILAPELPPRLEWLNVPFLRIDRQLGRNAVLLVFWDFARVNSIRTLPYLKAWHERYADVGLRVVGVHSPGYSFGRDREVVARAVERLEIPYPVALDPAFEVWRAYANRGWPGRYLVDRRGMLRDVHFGEGEYVDAELAIQEILLEIDDELDLPSPLEPLRAEDEPGVLMEPQSADVALPGDRDRVELVRDWTDGEDFVEARDAGAAANVSFRGGGAFAVLSGSVEPGLYETGGEVVAESPGLRLHGFQFTPAPPRR